MFTKLIHVLVVAAVTVSAAECVATDFAPVVAQTTSCSTDSGQNVSFAAFDPTKLTQYAALCAVPSCKTLFTGVSALTCTVGGAPLSAAALLCAGTTTTNTTNTTNATSAAPTTTAATTTATTAAPTTTPAAGKNSAISVAISGVALAAMAATLA
ncbi:Aste57867_19784 [Aphanomyces stellatus]|uniref:Aste57867_19784 protein n=1 Tax=Aphanomyces stellatus TaxID=120398 RepID=A0A485LEX2_9STRA|nr:hypothetical protein As57867_019719 [Aphanomyces stellatus]VFT96482.1 Aste57867_19784 [Aphanomyces stellatus]